MPHGSIHEKSSVLLESVRNRHKLVRKVSGDCAIPIQTVINVNEKCPEVVRTSSSGVCNSSVIQLIGVLADPIVIRLSSDSRIEFLEFLGILGVP